MAIFTTPRDEEIFIKHILKVTSSSYVYCFMQILEIPKAEIEQGQTMHRPKEYGRKEKQQSANHYTEN